MSRTPAPAPHRRPLLAAFAAAAVLVALAALLVGPGRESAVIARPIAAPATGDVPGLVFAAHHYVKRDDTQVLAGDGGMEAAQDGTDVGDEGDTLDPAATDDDQEAFNDQELNGQKAAGDEIAKVADDDALLDTHGGKGKSVARKHKAIKKEQATTVTATVVPTPPQTSEVPAPPETSEVPTESPTEGPTEAPTEAPAPTDTEAPAPTDTEAPAPTDTEGPAPTDTEEPTPTDTEGPAPTDTEEPTPPETTETEAPTTEVPAPTETSEASSTTTATMAKIKKGLQSHGKKGKHGNKSHKRSHK